VTRDRRAYLQAWRRRNPERTLDSRLRARYGITAKDRSALLLKQRNRCGGCRKPKQKWVVDHSHKTKKVRGILCNSCNLILGHAKDSPNTLRRLACYLEK
jgi:hypothetical protein